MADTECRILIVEDDTDARDALAAALGDAGFAVEKAGTGKQALARAAGGLPIDVLLVDMHLPDLSGSELLEKFRDLPGTMKARAIVLTGDTRLRMLDLTQQAKLLHKPFGLEELEVAVKEACAA